MLGTARSAYTILHRRLTVHDCLGYNRTLRGWVPILFLGAHRGVRENNWVYVIIQFVDNLSEHQKYIKLF